MNLVAQLPGPLRPRSRDGVLEHRLSVGGHGDSRAWFEGDLGVEDAQALRIGAACPSHGPPCQVVEIEYKGRLSKKPKVLTCNMEVWLVHADGLPVNAEGGFVFNAGTLSKTGKTFAANMGVFGADRLDMLGTRARMADVPITTYLNSVSDELQRRMS